MDRGAWWDIVHGVTKESDMTEQLNYDNKCLSGSLEPKTNNTEVRSQASHEQKWPLGNIHTWVVEV